MILTELKIELSVFIRTPSFHPASGMTPMTQTVVQQMERVARKPMTTFMVERERMGKASPTPIRIPRMALSARDCKDTGHLNVTLNTGPTVRPVFPQAERGLLCHWK